MIFTVWTNSTTTNGTTTRDIYFSKSTDNGGTFSFPDNISESSSSSNHPKLAVSNNNVYVVWHESFPSPNISTIFFTKSTDNGGTFSQIKNISSDTNTSGEPEIVVDEDNIHVVWGTTVNSIQDIFFTVSNDNGQTFGIPDNISESFGIAYFPKIAVVGRFVFVIWIQNSSRDIFFTVSDNHGNTFSQTKNISNSSGSCYEPQIAVSGEMVYVVWRQRIPGFENEEIFFSRSGDFGQTFSERQNISNTPAESRHPQIAVSGENVYVVWDDWSQPGGEIFFVVSNDNGQTFSQPENISHNTGSSHYPQIAASADNVYVVWFDYSVPINSDIFFARSIDNGQTFSEPQNISNNTRRSRYPQIAFSGDNVYVVWRNTVTEDIIFGNYNIFFAVSNDNGETFSQPENVSHMDGSNRDPQIAVSSSS